MCNTVRCCDVVSPLEAIPLLAPVDRSPHRRKARCRVQIEQAPRHRGPIGTFAHKQPRVRFAERPNISRCGQVSARRPSVPHSRPPLGGRRPALMAHHTAKSRLSETGPVSASTRIAAIRPRPSIFVIRRRRCVAAGDRPTAVTGNFSRPRRGQLSEGEPRGSRSIKE